MSNHRTYRLDLGGGGKPGIEILRHPDDRLLYFLFNDDQGRPLLFSQGHATREERGAALRGFIGHAAHPERYLLLEEEGRCYFVVRTDGQRELARSRWFDTPAEALTAQTACQRRLAAWSELFGGSSFFISEQAGSASMSVGSMSAESMSAESMSAESMSARSMSTGTAKATSTRHSASMRAVSPGAASLEELEAEQAEEWRRLLVDYERLVARATSDEERLFLLRKAAEICELRLHDKQGALRWLTRAFRVAEHHAASRAELEHEFVRLGSSIPPRRDPPPPPPPSIRVPDVPEAAPPPRRAATSRLTWVFLGTTLLLALLLVASLLRPRERIAESQAPCECSAPAGLKIEARPGSMEAELIAFLGQPGGALPRVFVMDRLRYPRASHEMNEEGKAQVVDLARILLAYPRVNIEIRGHIARDEGELYTGPKPNRNFTLSQLRADCVYRRLLNQKVPESRLRLAGLADTNPVASESTEEGRQANRRVEIMVLSK